MQNRRALLAASLLSGLLACTRAPQVETARKEPRVELLLADAEVWAWRTTVRARFTGAPLGKCAILRGERELTPPVAPAENGAFAREVPLEAGLNVIHVRCRDAEGRVQQSQPVRLTVKLADVPRAHASFQIHAHELALDASKSAPREGSGAKLVSFAWSRVERTLSALRETPLGSGVRVTVPRPTSEGEHEYAVRVRDERGREAVARLAVRVAADGEVHPLEEVGPDWIDHAIVYGVVPPLYGKPPLASVTKALDGLKELGVTALWLSPIFGSPPDDYGYAVTDYFDVRDSYGSEDDLRELVQQAHARGLRVLLDLVPNHTSNLHPYFVQAAQLGIRSHYFPFYARDVQGEPTHYFDWVHLPNLNYENPEVRRWSLAFSRYWVERFDIDGYRVDAAWGIRQRTPSFYPAFSSELRSVKPSLMLLAEASIRDPYYLRHGFDAAYDWTSELGHHAWESVFTSSEGIAARLSTALAEAGLSSPAPSRTLRFLNNNDTGARFITRHGEPLTRVATAALLTLPGIPCLFAFDELGAEYEPYDEEPPRTRELPGFRPYHRALIKLRKESRALSTGVYRELTGKAKGESFVFMRQAGAEIAIVALNFGATPAAIDVELPPETGLTGSARLSDALGARDVTLHKGRLQLSLGPWDVRVLMPGTPPPSN